MIDVTHSLWHVTKCPHKLKLSPGIIGGKKASLYRKLRVKKASLMRASSTILSALGFRWLSLISAFYRNVVRCSPRFVSTASHAAGGTFVVQPLCGLGTTLLAHGNALCQSALLAYGSAIKSAILARLFVAARARFAVSLTEIFTSAGLNLGFTPAFAPSSPRAKFAGSGELLTATTRYSTRGRDRIFPALPIIFAPRITCLSTGALLLTKTESTESTLMAF